jgi:general secretion pathway protein F
VIGAFIYPSFLLLLGATAVFVLMTFVIPRFQDLFRAFGQALPWPTQALIAVSGFLSFWWPGVLVAILVAVVGTAVILHRPSLRKRVDRMLLRLPVLGGMFLKLEMSRIARTLGALLKGGVKILPALRITAQTVRNQAIGASFATISDRVSGGSGLGAAMQEVKLYPPLVINLVSTGEDTGRLPEMLTELSSIYEDEAERAIAGAVKLLEPLMIVTMGIVIASIVAAVMLPIFQANVMVE